MNKVVLIIFYRFVKAIIMPGVSGSSATLFGGNMILLIHYSAGLTKQMFHNNRGDKFPYSTRAGWSMMKLPRSPAEAFNICSLRDTLIDKVCHP
jgi:hypothetical protein